MTNQGNHSVKSAFVYALLASLLVLVLAVAAIRNGYISLAPQHIDSVDIEAATVQTTPAPIKTRKKIKKASEAVDETTRSEMTLDRQEIYTWEDAAVTHLRLLRMREASSLTLARFAKLAVAAQHPRLAMALTRRREASVQLPILLRGIACRDDAWNFEVWQAITEHEKFSAAMAAIGLEVILAARASLQTPLACLQSAKILIESNLLSPPDLKRLRDSGIFIGPHRMLIDRQLAAPLKE